MGDKADEFNVAEMASFSGFATQDGAVIPPEKPAAAPKAATPAPKAPAADEGDDDQGAGADEGEGEGDQGEADGAQPGKDNDPVQKRINKAVARQRASERLAEAKDAENKALSATLVAMQARLDAIEKGTGVKPLTETGGGATVDPDAPKPDDYPLGEIDARYLAAVATHATKKALAEDQQARTKTQETAQQTADREALTAQVRELGTKGEKLYDDFNDLVLQGAARNEFQLSEIVGALILESDQGPHIAYELASDPELAKKVFEMPPAKQAAWFGKKEAVWELKAPKGEDDDTGEAGDQQSAQVVAPQAPPIPNTRVRAGRAAPTIDAGTGDFAAFEAMELARLSKQR